MNPLFFNVSQYEAILYIEKYKQSKKTFHAVGDEEGGRGEANNGRERMDAKKSGRKYLWRGWKYETMLDD